MTVPHLFWLLSAVVAILVLGSVIGELLRRRLSPGGEHPVVENLNARITAWWVMVILLSLALIAGRAGVVVLFALASFAALREFLTLTTHDRADHWSLLACFFVVLPLQYILVLIDWYGLYSVFVPVYVFLLLPVMSALRGAPRNFLVRIAEVQWALMVCVYCLSHVPALLYLDIPGFEGRNVMLIAYLIFIVQLSDVMQYVWGKTLGRRRVAPDLSPSKTWEGLVGGVLTASLVGAGLWWMTPFSLSEAAAMSLLATTMGFLGGLVMSAIKRDRGVKDWGHLLAGHGGVIDRLDSVIFAAPIFFHVTRYFWSQA